MHLRLSSVASQEHLRLTDRAKMYAIARLGITHQDLSVTDRDRALDLPYSCIFWGNCYYLR
jgi:hypothetical protein